MLLLLLEYFRAVLVFQLLLFLAVVLSRSVAFWQVSAITTDSYTDSRRLTFLLGNAIATTGNAIFTTRTAGNISSGCD